MAINKGFGLNLNKTPFSNQGFNRQNPTMVNKRINRLEGLQAAGNLSQGRQNRLDYLKAYKANGMQNPNPKPIGGAVPVQGGVNNSNNTIYQSGQDGYQPYSPQGGVHNLPMTTLEGFDKQGIYNKYFGQNYNAGATVDEFAAPTAMDNVRSQQAAYTEHVAENQQPQTGGPLTYNGPAKLNNQQRGTIRDIRQAYRPIHQNKADPTQISNFTNLRDPNMGLIDQRLERMGNKMNRLERNNINGVNDARINQLTNRQNRLNQIKAYQAPATTTTPTPDTTGADADAAAKAQQEYMANINKALFPESQSQQYYDWQKQQGMGALEKLMAARGLTNSGAEIEANSRFLNQLGAETSNTWMNRAQQSADRLSGIMNNQADRSLADRLGTGRNINDLLNTMLSTDVLGKGAAAAGKTADNRNAFGSSIANMIQNAYMRPGPTGGGAYPSFVPPMMPYPDMSGPNSVGAITGGANYMNLANDALSAIANLFR